MNNNRRERAAHRVPFKCSMRFKVLGDTTHSPDKTTIDGEILDLSDTGMKIREEGRSLQDGFVLVIRVPISETETTVPAMARVQWVKPGEGDFHEAGLMFVA